VVFDAFEPNVFAKPRGEYTIKTNVILMISKTATPENLYVSISKTHFSMVNFSTPKPQVLLLVPRETQYLKSANGDRFRLLFVDMQNTSKSKKLVLAYT